MLWLIKNHRDFGKILIRIRLIYKSIFRSMEGAPIFRSMKSFIQANLRDQPI